MNYEEFINGIISTRGLKGIKKPQYYETHHIIPKCMGGTDEFTNKIRLTAKEHYEAHRLLALENPDNEKLLYAWWCFSNGWDNKKQQRYKVTAKEYEEAKEKFRNMMSIKNSGINSNFYGQDVSGSKNPHFGKKHSEETKRLLSELATNRKMSEETKAKISFTLKSQNRTAWNKGIKLDEEHRQKVLKGLEISLEHRKKPVKQYDLQGNFIKLWPSATEAGKYFNIQGAHITDCCNNKRAKCAGFLWKFANDDKEIHPYEDSRTKKVVKLDKQTNEVIEIFESLALAAKSVNGQSANITVVCNPKYSTSSYKGFVWKYYEDYIKMTAKESDCEDNNDTIS